MSLCAIGNQVGVLLEGYNVLAFQWMILPTCVTINEREARTAMTERPQRIELH